MVNERIIALSNQLREEGVTVSVRSTQTACEVWDLMKGTTKIEDIGVCRRKETDRIEVMKSELTKLGAKVEEGDDYIIIHGHAPLTNDGKANPEFVLHGGTVESFHDHRVAMALACMGLGLPEGEEIIIKDAECCAVSFPNFFEAMNGIGAEFRPLN